MKTNYNRTVQACFIGYVVQAIVNNFVPLLFLTFQGSYGISLQKITLLVTFNFGIQLLVDLASIGFVDRIGYRASMILAHTMAAAGLILLTVLPECLGDPFVGQGEKSPQPCDILFQKVSGSPAKGVENGVPRL